MFDIYKSRVWKFTSRSVRSGRMAYRENLFETPEVGIIGFFVLLKYMRMS